MPRKPLNLERASVQDLTVVGFRYPGEEEWTRTSLAGMARGIPAYPDWGKVEWCHQPPAKFEMERVRWRPIWCGGYEVVQGERKFHHFEGRWCNCPPGPQVRGLCVRAHEVATGGGRGRRYLWRRWDSRIV